MGASGCSLRSELPSCDGIRAKLRRPDRYPGRLGRIWIENGAGKGGPIYLEAAKPITAPVTISTRQRNIQVVLPTGSTGDIELISSGTKLPDLHRAWTGRVDNTTIRPAVSTESLSRGAIPSAPLHRRRCRGCASDPTGSGNPRTNYYWNWYFTHCRESRNTPPRPRQNPGQGDLTLGGIDGRGRKMPA